jgi:thiamine biosynthesis lipoprotein
MGTTVLVAGLDATGQAAVLGLLREAERIFSRFTADSDTSRVNAAAGRPTRVSPLFTAALAEACAHQAASGGLFDPFLAADLVRLGYDRDFAAVRSAPAAPAAPPRPAGGGAPPRVRIDHGVPEVALSPGLAVDLGGFVKGWAVQRAAGERMRAGAPRGLIDAGGDIAAWRGPGGAPWRIGVEHPLDTAPAGVLALPPVAAVATSSVVRRGWRDTAGARLHHIIDPRTGAPADSDCLQATVLAADLAAAEVYATCLVLLGTGDGPAWLAGRDPAAAWITVDRDGRVRRSADLDLHREGAARP